MHLGSRMTLLILVTQTVQRELPKYEIGVQLAENHGALPVYHQS